MKLINDFFQIISTETVDGGFKCRTRLNANVTPGVCLLQMATEILSQEYGKKLVFCKGSNIKFKSLVGPHEEPEFLFTKTRMEDGLLSTNVSIERGETQFVKMSLQYKIVD